MKNEECGLRSSPCVLLLIIEIIPLHESDTNFHSSFFIPHS